jgi:hypothetical protein
MSDISFEEEEEKQKNKGGRPAFPDRNAVLSERLDFKVTKTELAALHKLSELKNQPLRTIIRETLVNSAKRAGIKVTQDREL